MKVLLIEPPFHRFLGFYRNYYPLGLAYLAAALEKHGHEVWIYDAEHDPKALSQTFLEASQRYSNYPDSFQSDRHPVWSEIQQEISNFEPDLVGLTVLTVKVPSALKIAAICRKVFPDIPVVVGGEHPTARPDDLLNDKNVNFVVRGEGERSICELVDFLASGQDPTEIDGLSMIKNGHVQHNKDRSLIDNLDDLPMPARHLLTRNDSYRPVDFGLIIGSRGCSFNCSFCTVHNIWKRRTRFRSVRRVIDEIKSVRDTYSTQYFSFRDYTFSTDKRWVQEFCKIVEQERLGIQWECTTRADLIDERLLALMKRSGCSTIRLGIESGSQRILDKLAKGVTVEKIESAAELLNRNEMYWTGYFMFDLPSETEKDIEKTLMLIDKINPPFVTMARYIPLPGSELFKTLVMKGEIMGEFNWVEFSNQSLQGSFTKTPGPKKPTDILTRVAKYINDHNRRNNFKNPHLLLKTD